MTKSAVIHIIMKRQEYVAVGRLEDRSMEVGASGCGESERAWAKICEA